MAGHARQHVSTHVAAGLRREARQEPSDPPMRMQNVSGAEEENPQPRIGEDRVTPRGRERARTAAGTAPRQAAP